jgi:hypothetical protein
MQQMNNESSASGADEETSNSERRSSKQGRDSPRRTPSPKEKSSLHALFLDGTDAWLQSNQTSGSDVSSIHTESTGPRPANATRESDHPPSVERTFDASEADYSEEEGPMISLATAPTFDDQTPPVEPSNEMELPEETRETIKPPSHQDEPPTQIYGSAESIVSMETTEDQEEEFENTNSDSSIISTEGRITTSSSLDSLGDSLHSDIGSLDHLFQKIQQQNRRSSWSTYKSLSTSSTSSDGDLRDVFIKDNNYSWVPAKVLEYQQDHALVAIDPPSNWQHATILQEETPLSSRDLHPSMTDTLPGDISRLTAEYDLPRCQLRKVPYKDYDLEEFPLQNLPGEGKRDMADLLQLHPASILYNLKDRHYGQKPYTRVGDIIIAMNPFMWLDELYTTETRDTYSINLIWEGKK